MEKVNIGRRGVIAGSTLLTAATMAGGKVSAHDMAKAIETDDPKFNLLTVARLEGNLTGAIIYSYARGQVHGLVPSDTLALDDYGKRIYDYEGLTIKRSRLRDDGAVESVSRALMLFVDPITGEYMKKFHNPYTGEVVPIKPFIGGISGTVMTENGPEYVANFSLESTVLNKPIALDYVTIGETTWVKRNAYTRWNPKGEDQAKTEFTLDVWQMKTADLNNASLSHIPSSHSWTSQTEWQTWTKMPDGHPGFVLWRSDGTKLQDLDQLPIKLREEISLREPAFLTAPLVFE